MIFQIGSFGRLEMFDSAKKRSYKIPSIYIVSIVGRVSQEGLKGAGKYFLIPMLGDQRSRRGS